MTETCTFCRIVAGELDADIVMETEEFLCLYDQYPVNEGHALVIPKQHVQHVEDCEKTANFFEFVDSAHEEILDRHDPDATNIGINNGVAAGQTIPHLHAHIIPRYDGDMDNPEGGVRGVIPDERTY